MGGGSDDVVMFLGVIVVAAKILLCDEEMMALLSLKKLTMAVGWEEEEEDESRTLEAIVDTATRGANVVKYLEAIADTLADEITMIAMIGIAIVLPRTMVILY